MLIGKTVNDGVVEALYESSNIAASKYYTDKNILSITFNTGMEYHYEGVDTKDYYMFELADSQGKIFNKYIKQHKFSKGDAVDMALLKEQREQIKQDELTRIANEIKDNAKLISEVGADLNIPQLKSFSQLINLFIEKKEEYAK